MINSLCYQRNHPPEVFSYYTSVSIITETRARIPQWSWSIVWHTYIRGCRWPYILQWNCHKCMRASLHYTMPACISTLHSASCGQSKLVFSFMNRPTSFLCWPHHFLKCANIDELRYSNPITEHFSLRTMRLVRCHDPYRLRLRAPIRIQYTHIRSSN